MSRLLFQRILGAIWLFDGILQLKPAMFTQGFVSANIGSNLFPGQAPWIEHLIHFEMTVASHPEWLFNLMIIIIQIGIGTALLVNIKARAVLIVSIVWALSVWLFGEGLGNIAAHQWSLTIGAPGAALLYAVMAVAVWPKKASDSWANWALPLVVSVTVIGWTLSAYEAWFHPGATTGFSSGDAKLYAIAAIAGVLLLLVKSTRQIGGMVLLLVSLVAWILMQQAGQFWMAYATDINSGGLWALLSLTSLAAVSTATSSRYHHSIALNEPIPLENRSNRTG